MSHLRSAVAVCIVSALIAVGCSSSGRERRAKEITVEAGGTIALPSGLTLEVPAEALEKDIELSIEELASAPEGYTALSPAYRFSPAGTLLKKPAKLRVPFTGEAKRATLFFSMPAAWKTTGWRWSGGVAANGFIESEISELGELFVADGSSYSERPDPTCASTKPVEGRGSPVGASSVSLVFHADDCFGRPLEGLTCSESPGACDFALREDDAPLSVEAVLTPLPTTGAVPFITVALDVSSSTQTSLKELVESVTSFVEAVQTTNGLNARISLAVFDRSKALTIWQRPSVDVARLKERLVALESFTPPDPNGTNLHGAIIDALAASAAEQTEFRLRNAGGVFPVGYTVLFTDGTDTAGIKSLSEAEAAIKASSDLVWVVGLKSPDYDAANIEKLAPHRVWTAATPAALETAFLAVGNRIVNQHKNIHALGYCSPKAAGDHEVSIDVAGSQTATRAAWSFNAEKFGTGCSLALFKTACDGLSCGGLGCGGCDERTQSHCDGSRCVDSCEGRCTFFPKAGAGLSQLLCWQDAVCDGSSLTNDYGYTQVCQTAGLPGCGACGEGQARIRGGVFTRGGDGGIAPQVVSVSTFCMDKHEAGAPATGVTWADAKAACEAGMRRLPTEAEWELAARGLEGRKYPWGNDPNPDCAHANFSGCQRDAEGVVASYAVPSGGLEAGKSPEGVADLAGNVAEWVADCHLPYDLTPAANPMAQRDGCIDRVTRGGSFRSDALSLSPVLRGLRAAGDSSEEVGYRCVSRPQ